MQAAGLEANTIVYNAALDACGRSGKPKVASKLLRKMKESGTIVFFLSYHVFLVPSHNNYAAAILYLIRSIWLQRDKCVFFV